MIPFQYHPDIMERFPDTVGGIILAQNISNQPSPEALKQRYITEQQAVIERIGSKPLSEIPALAAWRQTFRGFGVDPTKYRSAPESLLRRLTKKGDIPSINLLVDIGNLVSIRYALPIAFMDTRAVQGTITVHFADGTERYTELGSNESIHPETGEVVFSDETGMVVARRWCWRQSAESAANMETTNAIVTIEAQHTNGRSDMEQALSDLLALLEEYATGSFAHTVLDQANSVFSTER